MNLPPRFGRPRGRFVCTSLVGILALVLTLASAQADVTFVEIHVDARSPVASDANSGHADAPVKTLMEAVRRADANRLAGRATRVVVHPGTYREALIGPLEGREGPPIVIEASVLGEAIVSGSDVWTEWTCEERVCTHHWPFQWGDAEVPWDRVDMGPLGLRREMVFVDGAFVEQRLELSEVAVEPGTFFVDEREQALVVHLPTDVEPAAAVFEVSVRDRLLFLQGMHNLTIRGLVFEHGNPALPNTAVRIIDQNDVTVEHVTVRWNNWGGIWFKGSNLTMRDSVSTHNGGMGVSAYQADNLVLERNTSSYNNWRGYSGGLTGWAVGEKFLVTRDLVIRDHVAVHNLARGLWIDHDNTNVTIERLEACYNLNDGVFVERSQGPVRIIDSVMCHNGRGGLRTSATNGLEVVSSRLEGNEAAQLVISGDLDVRITSWFDGTVHSLENRSWQFIDNVFVGEGDNYLVSTSLPRSYWFELMMSARFEGNEYVHTRPDAFRIFGSESVDFERWQGLVFQDLTSRFRLQ